MRTRRAVSPRAVRSREASSRFTALGGGCAETQTRHLGHLGERGFRLRPPASLRQPRLDLRFSPWFIVSDQGETQRPTPAIGDVPSGALLRRRAPRWPRALCLPTRITSAEPWRCSPTRSAPTCARWWSSLRSSGCSIASCSCRGVTHCDDGSGPRPIRRSWATCDASSLPSPAPSTSSGRESMEAWSAIGVSRRSCESLTRPGFLGESRLLVSDPAALTHILLQRSYDCYPKPAQVC